MTPTNSWRHEPLLHALLPLTLVVCLHTASPFLAAAQCSTTPRPPTLRSTWSGGPAATRNATSRPSADVLLSASALSIATRRPDPPRDARHSRDAQGAGLHAQREAPRRLAAKALPDQPAGGHVGARERAPGQHPRSLQVGLHRAEVQRRRRPPPTTTTTTTIEAATASAWADAGRFGCFPARLRLSPLVTLQHLHSPFATVPPPTCVMWCG